MGKPTLWVWRAAVCSFKRLPEWTTYVTRPGLGEGKHSLILIIPKACSHAAKLVSVVFFCRRVSQRSKVRESARPGTLGPNTGSVGFPLVLPSLSTRALSQEET